jgi:hypothetical protein
MFATPLPPSGLQSIRTLGDGAAAAAPTSSFSDVYSTPATSSTISEILPSFSSAPAGAGWSWTTWGLIIIGLSVLGLNVFAYLAKGADAGAWVIRTFITPIFSIFGLETINTAKQILKTSDDGASATSAAGISVLDAIETGLGGDAGAGAASTGGAATSTGGAATSTGGAKGGKNVFLDIAPRDSTAQVPEPVSTTGDNGWCLIGEDSSAGNIRTCASVGAADKCMSGDVFPTQEICVNPSLRS